MSLANRLISFHFVNAVTGESKTVRIPRGVSVYRLKALVARTFAMQPMRLRLVWETGEWDPLGGTGDDSDQWSVGSATEDVDEKEGEGKGWIKREVELMDGTREVGFWIEGKQATVRVEERNNFGGKA